MSSSSSLKIMVFSWNADGLRICETMNAQKAQNDRRGFFKRHYKKPCITPDFFADIRDVLQQQSPDVVIMSTEQEADKDTYFHSHFLPQYMGEIIPEPNITYTLLLRDVQPYNVSLDIKNTIATGPPDGVSLRMSIYIKDSMVGQFSVDRSPTFGSLIKNSEQKFQHLFLSKSIGVIMMVINHHIYGSLTFICTHISSLADAGDRPDHYVYNDVHSHRTESMMLNNIFLSRLLDDVTKSSTGTNHIFLLGDFDFNIITSNSAIKNTIEHTNKETLQNLLQYDELTICKKFYPLRQYNEGVNNEGPMFIPDWKLSKNRPPSCNKSADIKCFDINQSDNFGWHSRILYRDIGVHYITRCTSYNRIDVGNMKFSAHAGVFGIYRLDAV